MRFPLAGVSRIVLLSLMAVSLTGCAAESGADAPSNDSSGAGHGKISGARELAEPALHLTTVDAAGVVHHFDLLDEQSSVLAEIEPIEDLVTDGRYLFGIRDGSVTVIDSGVWSWSHIDHFHYYEAPSRVVGDIEGSGLATVVIGETGTGIRFDDEAVLIETPSLADGELVEQFRIAVDSADGLFVPLNDGAVVGESETALRIIAADGTPADSVPCAKAAGTISTVVGVVIGCDDGAALAIGGNADDWEMIPYPEGAAPSATAFDGRKGRPSVAALAGDEGVWVLDTRARTWTFQDLGESVVRAAAVDDDAGRVLALTADGSVLVVTDGEIVARTVPLVAASLADPELAAGVRFVVDRERAYVNGPAENMAWEIDAADDARIARAFEMSSAPLHLAGTGR